ncbi:MAG: 2-oxoacid:acceptor oxidoreductase family protein, partial [Pseudomonadota bacterium]
METTNIVLCGLGGQGILFMTKVVAHAALAKGFQVMGAETHGMAQRGGSVISHLRLGEVQSSLIRAGSAHLLLSLDENEGYRNLPFLARNSRMFVNSGPGRFP